MTHSAGFVFAAAGSLHFFCQRTNLSNSEEADSFGGMFEGGRELGVEPGRE